MSQQERMNPELKKLNRALPEPLKTVIASGTQSGGTALSLADAGGVVPVGQDDTLQATARTRRSSPRAAGMRTALYRYAYRRKR